MIALSSHMYTYNLQSTCSKNVLRLCGNFVRGTLSQNLHRLFGVHDEPSHANNLLLVTKQANIVFILGTCPEVYISYNLEQEHISKKLPLETEVKRGKRERGFEKILQTLR